jgi:hypothetical protein
MKMTIITVILFIILILIISYIIIYAWHQNKYAWHQNKYAWHQNKYAWHQNKYARHQNKYGGVATLSKELSYAINGEDSGLDYTQLRKILNASNFKEVDKSTPNVHLSIGGFDEKSFKEKGQSAYSESFLKQYAALKNLLDKHRMVTEKTQLYTTMQNNIPLGMKYLPYTNSLANIKNIDELFFKSGAAAGNNSASCIYVLKVNKSRQTGIKIISSAAELNAAIKELNITKKEDAIISKYITNPLTIDGKKFHLRVYFLVYIRWGITYCTAFDDYKILTAASPYVQRDWLNESIHLSGGKNTAKRYYWEDIAKTVNEETKTALIQCIKTICRAIVLTGMQPFGEADSAYHTLGADLILTDDNMAYLLEINRRAAMTQIGENEGWEEYNKKFSYNYFMFIANHVIFPYFGLNLPHLAYAAFANGFHSSLAEFSHSFIENKLELLPLLKATEADKQSAHKIHFYSLLSFQTILNSAPEHNIWIILKNNEIIGYTCIEYAPSIFGGELLPSIKVGISQGHQRRQLGTAIIALVIEIYAAREFPKNPHIYLPILQNIHTRDAMPTNKIALRLGFEINHKLKMYSRSCKIMSKKLEKSLLHIKMYIISELHNDKELKIFEPYFIKKEGYSFAHIVFGKIQNNEFYLSNGVQYTVNFLNQGAEIKNCIKMKDGIIYKKYRLYGQLKDAYELTKNVHFLNAANRCKNMALDYFKTYLELIEHGKNNKFIFYNDKVDKFTVNKTGTISEIIKSQEDFNRINSYEYMSQITGYSPFKINNMSVSYLAAVIIYKSSGIVYAYLEYELIHMAKKENINDIYIIGEDTTNMPYKDFKLKHLTDEQSIDKQSLDENLKACVYLLINNAQIYTEQYSGFHKYGILNSLYKIGDKIIPYISEIYSMTKNMTQIDDINFIGKNIILPHFGIMQNGVSYMTHNSNDGALSKFYNNIIHMAITIDEKKNNLFYIYFNEKKIGHIELEIIDYEIEIKHIELDVAHRNKKRSAPAIAYLLEILGARYSPLNPIIFFKQLESIAEKLEFYKIKKEGHYIYKRLCRLKKFIL